MQPNFFVHSVLLDTLWGAVPKLDIPETKHAAGIRKRESKNEEVSSMCNGDEKLSGR